MTTEEISKLTSRIDGIVRESRDTIDILDVEIVFRPDHHGDPSVYVTVEMAPGAPARHYAEFLTDLAGRLTPETHTSDGFLFPYVRSRIGEEAA